MLTHMKKWRETRIKAYEYALMHETFIRNIGYEGPQSIKIDTKMADFLKNNIVKWKSEITRIDQVGRGKITSEIFSLWKGEVLSIFTQYKNLIWRAECNYKRVDTLRAKEKKNTGTSSTARKSTIESHNGRAQYQKEVNEIFITGADTEEKIQFLIHHKKYRIFFSLCSAFFSIPFS